MASTDFRKGGMKYNFKMRAMKPKEGEKLKNNHPFPIQKSVLDREE